MFSRLFSFLLLLGGLCGLGFAFFVAFDQFRAGEDPLPAEMVSLENGQLSPGRFYRFNRFLTDYSSVSYAPNSKESIECVYYPVISEDNAEALFFRKTAHPTERLNPVRNKFENFGIIVRDYHFQNVKKIPKGIHEAGPETAFYAGSVRTLPPREQRLLFDTFPNVPLDRLQLLEIGREPWPWSVALGSLCLSFLCFLLCLGIAYLQKTPVERKRRYGLGLRNPFSGDNTP